MDWKSISSTVGKAAPLLGTLLGGPAGGAVGAIVASALGTDATPDAVAAALSSPDATVKLRQIEADRSVRLQELVTDQAKADLQIAADDRKNARDMQRETRSKVPAVLAIGITLGFFGILVAMIVGQFKPADNEALLILLGSLGTSWGAVVNYYFGSSAGSARKDEILAKANG